MVLDNYKICIIGLGYVGLPLAVAFAKKYKVIGFDIDKSRINQLKLTPRLDPMLGSLRNHQHFQSLESPSTSFSSILPYALNSSS